MSLKDSGRFYGLLAKLAYRDGNETNEEWAKKLKPRLAKYINHLQDCETVSVAGIEAYSAWTDSKHFVSIRGTDSSFDVLRDIAAALRNPVNAKYGTKLAAPFWEAGSILWNELQPQLRASHAEGRSIRVTAHSLGGSLAEVLCAKMAQDDDPIYADRLVTFAQPRTGKKTWSTYMQSLWSPMGREFRRYQNSRDPVPRMLWFSGYRHGVNPIFIDRHGDIHDGRKMSSLGFFKFSQWENFVAWWNSVNALECHRIESYIDALR